MELTGTYPSSDKFLIPEFRLLPVSIPWANLGKGDKFSDSSTNFISADYRRIWSRIGVLNYKAVFFCVDGESSVYCLFGDEFLLEYPLRVSYAFLYTEERS